MTKRYSFKTWFYDLYSIWIKELGLIVRDHGVLIFFFIVPLAYPFLYASFYNTEIVVDSPIVVVNQDGGKWSREFIRRIDATPNVSVKKVVSSLEEANKTLKQKDAYGVLLIDRDFDQDIALQRQAQVELYSDLSSILHYKNFMLGVNTVSLDMGRELTASKFFDVSDKVTDIHVHYVKSQDVAYFNPQSGFASFLLPAILILIMQQTLLLGICLLAGTAREKNQWDTLIPNHMAQRGGPLRVLMAKALAYLTVYIPNSLWLFVVVPHILQIPQLFSPIDLLLFIAPFLLATTFFGIFLSLFVKHRENTMIYLVFTSVIFFFLVGASWPEHAIPWFWKAFAFLIPSTAGARGFIALNGMGASLSEIRLYYYVLWIQTLVYFILAAWGYKRQYHRIQEKKQHPHL